MHCSLRGDLHVLLLLFRHTLSLGESSRCTICKVPCKKGEALGRWGGVHERFTRDVRNGPTNDVCTPAWLVMWRRVVAVSDWHRLWRVACGGE